MEPETQRRLDDAAAAPRGIHPDQWRPPPRDRGSIRARLRPNPESDAFEFRTFLDGGSLAALRLETLPHDSLPKKSAARADDGRFRLSEIEAEIIEFDKDGNPGKPRKPKSVQAVADAFEPKFEVANAIDGKAETGWGVSPAEVAETAHRFVRARRSDEGRDQR